MVATQFRSGKNRRWLSLIATSGTSRCDSSSSGRPGHVEPSVERRDHGRRAVLARTRTRGSPRARARCRTGAPRATRSRWCAACSSRGRRGTRSTTGSARRSGCARRGPRSRRPRRGPPRGRAGAARRRSPPRRARCRRSVGGGTGSSGGATSRIRRRSGRRMSASRLHQGRGGSHVVPFQHPPWDGSPTLRRTARCRSVSMPAGVRRDGGCRLAVAAGRTRRCDRRRRARGRRGRRGRGGRRVHGHADDARAALPSADIGAALGGEDVEEQEVACPASPGPSSDEDRVRRATGRRDRLVEAGPSAGPGPARPSAETHVATRCGGSVVVRASGLGLAGDAVRGRGDDLVPALGAGVQDAGRRRPPVAPALSGQDGRRAVRDRQRAADADEHRGQQRLGGGVVGDALGRVQRGGQAVEPGGRGVGDGEREAAAPRIAPAPAPRPSPSARARRGRPRARRRRQRGGRRLRRGRRRWAPGPASGGGRDRRGRAAARSGR